MEGFISTPVIITQNTPLGDTSRFPELFSIPLSLKLPLSQPRPRARARRALILSFRFYRLKVSV